MAKQKTYKYVVQTTALLTTNEALDAKTLKSAAKNLKVTVGEMLAEDAGVSGTVKAVKVTVEPLLSQPLS